MIKDMKLGKVREQKRQENERGSEENREKEMKRKQK